jgi:hypothetical protein
MRLTGDNFSEIFALAMTGGLDGETLQSLSLHTRCRLIANMADTLKQNPKIDWQDIVSNSLERVSKSFQVSDNYFEWEDAKTRILEKRLKHKKYRSVLNAFRHWSKMPEIVKREALKEVTSLQHATFVEGLADPLPISHTFVHWNPYKIKGQALMLYGTFNGSFSRSKGKIKQNTHEGAKFNDPLHALDTGLHEMCHGIHFSLANEYHHARIRPDHPLHEEARYFHALEVRKADVPPTFYHAYRAQAFEFLAETGGTRMAQMIYGLAI